MINDIIVTRGINDTQELIIRVLMNHTFSFNSLENMHSKIEDFLVDEYVKNHKQELLKKVNKKAILNSLSLKIAERLSQDIIKAVK